MSINIRKKGACGERDICNILNELVDLVREEIFELRPLEKDCRKFQRNQNQSAVGGSDISNDLGLSIEVKRQETLSLNTWWKQTLDSAEKEGGLPILFCRKSRQPWRVFMLQNLRVVHDVTMSEPVRVEISISDFKKWFYDYYVLF